MKKNNKKLTIALGILVIILIVLIAFSILSLSSNNQEETSFTASNRIINEANAITETVVNEQEQNTVQNEQTEKRNLQWRFRQFILILSLYRLFSRFQYSQSAIFHQPKCDP